MRGISRCVHSTRGVSQAPLGSVLRLSQPLDGFLHTLRSRAYFIPQTTCRVRSRSGASLLAQRPFLIGRHCPHAVTAWLLAGRNRLPPPCASTSRPYSTRSSVCHGLRLIAPQTAPLFGFAFPPGSPFSRRKPPFPRSHPLMTFVLESLRLHTRSRGPPSAYYQRETRLVRLQTADLLETFGPSNFQAEASG